MNLLGKLTFADIPHDPIIITTLIGAGIGGLLVLALITKFKLWGYLWKEWFTSVDHKKIGVMYLIVAFVMLLRGFADAIMMRVQQAMAAGGNEGILPPHHYDQIFTAHGVIMIFFVAMPLITGLMNVVVPLQIGARDVAFPFVNSLSFWLFVAGAGLVMISLGVGEFAQTGWLAFPPLSGKEYSPGVGVDYYIWGLQVAGLGTTLSGINFFITILKMRTPGMKLMQMPIFTWTALVTNVLIIAAFPVLTITLVLLTLDRYLGTHFFTNDGGGNAMLYINLIWIWGHPEVYILVLPAFGVFSEVIATFSRKALFGYKGMVYATACIGVLSFLVWLHHFFTMGSGANVIIGGVVFGMFAGITYWWPKMFGFRLNETWGKRAFWCWFIGFYVAFMPLYILGFMGMTRRMQSYPNMEYQPLLIIAMCGAFIIGAGILCQIIQIAVSIRDRKKTADLTGDPWDARTLEWETSSPPSFYNFGSLPRVNELDEFWERKQRGEAWERPAKYTDIHMPRNTGTGVVIGAFSLVFGFAMIWHIWWLAIVGLVGMIGTFIWRTFDKDVDYYVPAAEVERIENEHRRHLVAQGLVKSELKA